MDVIEVLGKHIYERMEEIKRKAKILEEKKAKEEKDKEIQALIK